MLYERGRHYVLHQSHWIHVYPMNITPLVTDKKLYDKPRLSKQYWGYAYMNCVMKHNMCGSIDYAYETIWFRRRGLCPT